MQTDETMSTVAEIPTDNVADLENALKDSFRDYSMKLVGCVALFAGHT